MKISLMIVMVLAYWTLPAKGRIGETLEQCIARYGKPGEHDVPPLTNFIKGKFIISVEFQDSKAAIIFYAKTEHEASGEPVPLSDTEIAILLKDNGGEQQWKQILGNR